ncbi:MAG: phage holin family protein [Clostridia bacterium]|nr:phage holin family protein [Clostridia bacterium]
MHTDKIKLALLSALGAVAVFFEAYSSMLIAVTAAVALDVVTGLIKAKVAGNVSSHTMRKGLLRKIGLFLALGFGVFLDWFIPELGIVKVAPSFKEPFALMICAYIVVNEGISICENLYAIDPKTVPRFIARWLKIAGDSLDENNNGADGTYNDNKDNNGDDNNV